MSFNQLSYLARTQHIDTFRAVALHGHPQSAWREEGGDLGAELRASPKLTGWEGDGEGAVGEVQETNRGSALPEAREDVLPEGEPSTLLTAAGSSQINY